MNADRWHGISTLSCLIAGWILGGAYALRYGFDPLCLMGIGAAIALVHIMLSVVAWAAWGRS